MVGNDRFEGICVDLLREISRLLGFHFQLRLVRDGAYGSRDSHGHWNGMVRELLEMHSKHETYERMWNVMKDDLVSSNAEGVERVERGGYAFLMESTSIEYVAQRRCKLTQLRGLLDSKGYGIAMPQAYSQQLFYVFKKAGHFKRSRTAGGRSRTQRGDVLTTRWRPGPTQVSEPGLPNVGGVFVVLLAGLGLACLIAFAEFFFKARSSREKRRNASTGASTSGRPVDVSVLNALFCFSRKRERLSCSATLMS
ncbi:hypothetical protein MRX96_005900 [Rhipicephalus microplus]